MADELLFGALQKGGGVKIDIDKNDPDNLSFKFIDDPTGQFNVISGSGDTEIGLAKDTRVRASLTTGSGAVSNDLSVSESADFGVSVKTGSGDVRVKAY